MAHLKVSIKFLFFTESLEFWRLLLKSTLTQFFNKFFELFLEATSSTIKPRHCMFNPPPPLEPPVSRLSLVLSTTAVGV